MLGAYLAAAAAGAAFCAGVVALAEELNFAQRLEGAARMVLELTTRALAGATLSPGERRRLIVLGALCGLLGGFLLSGPPVGVLTACALAWTVSRLAPWQRRRYRSRFERQLPEIATGLANALTGGHAIRAAVIEAAREVGGPAGAELARAAAEIAVGASTDRALEEMRLRIGSRQLDVMVGAILIQNRSGGDLAKLLREVASIYEDRQRLAHEARTASAQARFTGKLVVAMPFVVAAIMESIDPGFVTGVFTSFAGVWLVALAAVLQVAGALAIRRIARIGIQ